MHWDKGISSYLFFCPKKKNTSLFKEERGRLCKHDCTLLKTVENENYVQHLRWGHDKLIS